jgi:hypothetical protein
LPAGLNHLPFERDQLISRRTFGTWREELAVSKSSEIIKNWPRVLLCLALIVLALLVNDACKALASGHLNVHDVSIMAFDLALGLAFWPWRSLSPLRLVQK